LKKGNSWKRKARSAKTYRKALFENAHCNIENIGRVNRRNKIKNKERRKWTHGNTTQIVFFVEIT